jgi:hypothetical protein
VQMLLQGHPCCQPPLVGGPLLRPVHEPPLVGFERRFALAVQQPVQKLVKVVFPLPRQGLLLHGRVHLFSKCAAALLGLLSWGLQLLWQRPGLERCRGALRVRIQTIPHIPEHVCG